MSLEEYRLIDDQSALEPALEWLADLPVVGIDVERADWNRYYRAAALVQVGGEGRVVLLDPLSIADFSPLAAFVQDRLILLHALENDVGPLQSLGVDPPTIHDTAIAAALLGLPIGLESLLAEALGVEVAGDKAAMQRADWERRPLTPEMLQYAAGDVADLPELWQLLEDRLLEVGRFDWYEQELNARLTQPAVEERRGWERTKGVGRLDPKARARAKALWETREDLARGTDTAPGRIINDRVLLDLALRPPTQARELGRRGVRRQAVRTFGDQLLLALQQADGSEPVPVERRGRRSTDADRDLADALRAIRADIAQQVGLDAGLLCPSRHLLKAVMADPSSPEELREALGLRDWQWRLLENAFVDVLLKPLEPTAPGSTPPVPEEG